MPQNLKIALAIIDTSNRKQPDKKWWKTANMVLKIWLKPANPLYLKLKSVMYNGINEFLKVDIKRSTNASS